MKKIELNILIFILIEALFLLYGIKINIINILLGTFLGIILITLFSNFKKNKIMAISLLIITIILYLDSLLKISTFIIDNIINNYSIIFILLSIIIVNYLIIKNNYHSFIKYTELSFYFFIILKIISFSLIIPNFNFNNLNYKLIDELNINTNIINVGITIFILYFLIYYLTNQKSSKKIILISIFNPLIIKLSSFLIIGKTLFYLYQYPYMNILKRIKYLDFIERMEGILSFTYILSFFILSSFLLLVIKELIKYIFNKQTIQSTC